MQLEIEKTIINLELGESNPNELGKTVATLIIKYEKNQNKTQQQYETLRKLTSSYVNKYGMDMWDNCVKKEYYIQQVF